MRLRSPQMLKAHMEHRGLSIGQLATFTSCNRAMIGHLRTGYRTSCSALVAGQISEALGVDLDVLFVPIESARCVDSVHAGSGKNSRKVRTA